MWHFFTSIFLATSIAPVSEYHNQLKKQEVE